MDKYNFGDSPAAIILVELVTEIPSDYERNKVRRKVSRFFCDYNAVFTQLHALESKKTKSFLFNLLRKEVLEKKLDLPTKIETYSKNVLVSQLREKLIGK